MIRAFVVGGVSSFLKSTLAPHLARVGIEVGWHVEMDERKTSTTLPAACGVLIVYTDTVGHRQYEPLREEAKARGVPVVMTTRKWAQMRIDLAKHGFTEPEQEDAPMPELPVTVTKAPDIDTFETLQSKLRAVCQELFAQHGVIAITVDADNGIEIEQRHTVKVAL